MPVLFIEALPGIRPEKKRVMMQKITEAIDEAYHISDTLIFLRGLNRQIGHTSRSDNG